MKLRNINIDHYKNLNTSFSFENNTGYISLIGLNGSGKSNLLEAISLLFAHMMGIEVALPFDKYSITYDISGHGVDIDESDSLDNGTISEDDLPSTLIACYSGEDNRLWDSGFNSYYIDFFNKAIGGGEYKPKVLYINKLCWKIAFLSLLFSENEDVKRFITDKLQINIESVNVQFITKEDADPQAHDASNWYNRVKSKYKNTTIQISDLKNNEDVDLGCSKHPELTNDQIVFYYLYFLHIPDKQSTPGLKADKVIEKIDISVNGYNFDDLSEGEKKLILIECITKVLGDENSLVLLDEPDAHTHITMKKDLLKLISDFAGQTVMTTHSPMFLNKRWDGYDEKNIFYIHDGKIEDTEPLKHLAELTDNEVDFFDSAYILGAKNLLIVEGPNDKRYLEKAISIFSKRDEIYNKLSNVTILPGNSAGNAEALYDLVLKQKINKMDNLVYLFDYDGGGYDGYKAIKKIENPKVKSLFYQHDYSQEIDLSAKPKDKDTIMAEDFFSTDAYSAIIEKEEIEKKQSHKDFRNFKTNIASAIKTHIENHYNSSSFKEEWYDGFKPVLNKLLEVFNLD